MPARRRRPGSESDQQPFIVVTEGGNSWSTNNQTNLNHTSQLYHHSKDATSNNNQFLEESDSKPNIGIVEEMTTSRDRTTEFEFAIRSLQGKNVARAAAIRDPRKARFIQSHSEFMLIAKTIGKNVASTYAKLEKLTTLAKKKSLFDDRSSEIQELTYIIKGDLSSLNQQIARLQEVSKSQSSSSRNLQSHSSNVLLSLQSRLATMSTDFKQILEVRTENLKQQKNRRDQFSQASVSSSLPPSVVSGHHHGSVLLAEEQVSIDLEPNSNNQLVQRQQQQMIVYDETDNYLQSRAETMQNIESTIVELGGIFQQLAYMVKEQEEMVERIDSNVQEASMNIEGAHGEILKYFQSVTSNRWLMIKIFAVLIAFFIFFVVFMA